jgi:hypothetical protein
MLENGSSVHGGVAPVTLGQAVALRPVPLIASTLTRCSIGSNFVSDCAATPAEHSRALLLGSLATSSTSAGARVSESGALADGGAGPCRGATS